MSKPTNTPLPGFPARTTYRAIACATTATFSSVKSSAITPRQPSVPNRIVVVFVVMVVVVVIGKQYKRCANVREGIARRRFA